MTHTAQDCQRPWRKRPLVWFIAIAAMLLFVVVAAEQTDKPTVTPYSAFVDQVDAGNVASVTFQGTVVHGRFKRPLDNARDVAFLSRIPDFGDPTLIPELRKQRVVIEVTSPSTWSWLLGSVPWPMLIIVGAMLVAGLIRFLRGGTPQAESATPVRPMPGMVGTRSKSLCEAASRPDASCPLRRSAKEPVGFASRG